MAVLSMILVIDAERPLLSYPLDSGSDTRKYVSDIESQADERTHRLTGRLSLLVQLDSEV